MILVERFEEQFKRENIIKNLATYEIFYQISLGYIIAKSEFDVESTYQKIEELSLEIDPERVLYVIVNAIKNNNKKENFRTYFDDELQKEASINALNDYIAHDKELIHPEYFVEELMEKILDNKFFNPDMRKRFYNVYDDEIKRWEEIITPEFVNTVKNAAISKI